MTVENISRRAGPFIGDGTVTAFPFEFKIFDASQIIVYKTNEEDAEIALKLNEDYTVSLNTDQDESPGGTITLAVPLESERRLALVSAIKSDQQVKVTNYDRFFPIVFNDVFDKLTGLIQQLEEQMNRALLTLPTDTMTPLQLRYELIENTKNAVSSAVKALQSETNAAISAAASKEYADKLLAFKDQILTVSDNIKSVGITAENAEAIAEIAKNLEELLKSKDYAAEAKGWAEKANAITGGQSLIIPGGTSPLPVLDWIAAKPHVFKSVAEMKAAKFLAPGMTTVTQGYYEPGDGGGAVYVVRKKTDEDKDNTGAIHFLQGDLVAELIVERVVSVKWFGAKGDGNNDDTRAIQKSIDFLFNAGIFGIVVIPRGNFIFTSICVKTGLTFQGEGGILKLKDNTCTDSSKNYYLIHNLGYSNVTYDNLVIDGNGDNNSSSKVADAITAVNEKTIVRNCKIYNSPDSGIMFSDAPGGKCINNFIDTGNDLGIYVNAPEVTPAKGDMICSGNVIKNFPYGGIGIKRSIENCIVSGNIILECGNGITVEDFGAGNGGAPDHLLITGNLLKNIGFPFRGVSGVSEVGIALNGCTNVVVNDNKFQKISGIGISLAGTTDSSIQNNHLTGYPDSPLPSGNYGLRDLVRTGVSPARNIVSGNIFTGFKEFGIKLNNSVYSIFNNNIVQAKSIAFSISENSDFNTIAYNRFDGEIRDIERYAGTNGNIVSYNFLTHAGTTWEKNGHLRYTGLTTPVGTVSPWFPGQLCMTTSQGTKIFMGIGSENTDWIQIGGASAVTNSADEITDIEETIEA